MAEDQPAFNENIELFKLQVLSEDERASHNTMTAAWLALFIGYAIYLLANDHDLVTYYVALTLGGASLIVALLLSESIPHRAFMQRMNDYVRQVQRRERLPDFKDLDRRGTAIRNWLRSRPSRSVQSRPERRGLGFFIQLALALWFTGLFAWSQTVLWQSTLSAIMKASSLTEVQTIAAYGIAETLIISILFAGYLWVIYNVSAPFREVFDGLFGLRRKESEATNPVT